METQRTALQKTSISQDERNFSYKASRDGILGHKFNKRLESSTGGFERIFISGIKNPYRKSTSLFMKSICITEDEGSKPDKNS
jgi:hypothetical protein